MKVSFQFFAHFCERMSNLCFLEPQKTEESSVTRTPSVKPAVSMPSISFTFETNQQVPSTFLFPQIPEQKEPGKSLFDYSYFPPNPQSTTVVEESFSNPQTSSCVLPSFSQFLVNAGVSTFDRPVYC